MFCKADMQRPREVLMRPNWEFARLGRHWVAYGVGIDGTTDSIKQPTRDAAERTANAMNAAARERIEFEAQLIAARHALATELWNQRKARKAGQLDLFA